MSLHEDGVVKSLFIRFNLLNMTKNGSYYFLLISTDKGKLINQKFLNVNVYLKKKEKKY